MYTSRWYINIEIGDSQMFNLIAMVTVDEKAMARAIMSMKRSADEVGHDCRVTATAVYKEMGLNSKQYITKIKEIMEEDAAHKPPLLQKNGRFYNITKEGLKYYNDNSMGGHTWVEEALTAIKTYGHRWPEIDWEAEMQYHPTWFKRARLPALLHDRFFLDGINRNGIKKSKVPPMTGWEGNPVDVLN